jgi:hypothetical protein
MTANPGLKTINLFGSPHRRFLFLGPSYGTTRNHYGHFCPLVGKHAQTEVFPHIEAFISEFDRPADPEAAAPVGGRLAARCAGGCGQPAAPDGGAAAPEPPGGVGGAPPPVPAPVVPVLAPR